MNHNPEGIRCPQTTDDLKLLYNYIYKQKKVNHPGKGRLGDYGSHVNRDRDFLDNIRRFFKPGSRILDASCGLGHLALSLKNIGYEVEGTEISEHLVNVKLKDIGFKVHLLAYDELDQLPEKSFDCVCSNDVLEHLIDRPAVIDALSKLVRLSRRGVALAIGMKNNARKYTTALRISETGQKLPTYNHAPKTNQKLALDLHRVTPGANWWFAAIWDVMDIHSFILSRTHLFVFGWVKK